MKSSFFALFCLFTLCVSLNTVFGADTPLQLSVDGRREKIDSCSSSACSPFTNCRTWLAPKSTSDYPDSLVYYYPTGVNSPISLSSAIVTTASGSGTSSILFGNEYYQPWPGQVSSTSGLTWKGNYVSQVVAGQPFIIGALGHKNFAISTYDRNGNLVIPVCNYFQFAVTFEITNLQDTSQNFFHSLTLDLKAEETPNDGCNYLYDEQTIGIDNAVNPWYGAATPTSDEGKCPYGPDCTTTCSRSIEVPIIRPHGGGSTTSRSTTRTTTTTTTTTTTCNSCTCGAGCNDRITIPQTGLTDGFTFNVGSNTYFLTLLGFTSSTTYQAGAPVQEFVTYEGQSNIAYLWAKIDQACSSSADCSDGISCSTGTCVDHTNANLNPNGFPFDFCTFTYDDSKCKPSGEGCATGTCGPSGCTTLVSNSYCSSHYLSPNAVCKTATCDLTATNTYNCVVHDVSGSCDAFSQANGFCNTICNSDGTCACAPTTTTTTTTTTTPKPTTTTTTTTTPPPTTTTTTTLPGTTAPGTTTTTTALPTTTTTTTTTPTTTTTTTTTTPPCTDPCALCNLPSDFQADCSKCPYNSGFKNICVYNNGGGWNLVQDVPNDQVYLYFDTPLERQQNYFPGDTHLDLDWKTKVPSTCDCNYVTTTTSTTTPAPRSPLIIPTVLCTQCFSNTHKCFATIGYDARNVWADPSTPDSPIVSRYQGTNNFFTKNSDPTPFQLNQPEQFLRDLVNNAAIIEFDEGDKLTWHLDGNTVDISSTGSLDCDKCEVPALITVTPVSSDTSLGAVYEIDFSHRSDFCSSTSPSLTHFIIDVPLCRTVGFSVYPPQCLRNDGTAAAPGYIPNNGWDTSAINPDCFFLSLDPVFISPFSVPLFDTPDCQQITISLSIDTSICPNVHLGTTSLSALYDDICPNCQTCKSSSLFGVSSSCTEITCQSGQTFRTDTCECEPCTESTLNCPPFWFANLNSCDCKKCPATCPDGQYLDAKLCCQPCPNGICCTDTPTVCPPGYVPDGKICACSECPVPNCQDGTELDATRCGCVECLPDGCPSGYIQSMCDCIPVTVDTPATTPPGCPPENIDVCGVCDGDGTSCAGCDGKPGTGRWVDACHVECGDGSSCPSCLNDNCNVCTLPVDICGICGGNGSSCLGCDGLPPTLTRPATKYDWCGICGGNGTSCLGCGGVPFAGPCPSGITPGAAAAVASLSALAALSAIALAAVLLRLRKRPELLYQAWDDTLRDYITEIESNPLYDHHEQDHNPLFEHGHHHGH